MVYNFSGYPRTHRRKKMKRFKTLFGIVALVFSIGACGGDMSTSDEFDEVTDQTGKGDDSCSVVFSHKETGKGKKFYCRAISCDYRETPTSILCLLDSDLPSSEKQEYINAQENNGAIGSSVPCQFSVTNACWTDNF
jgi:hypothetical protein